MVNHFSFEWTIFGVIIINTVFAIVGLVSTHGDLLMSLRIINYVFVFIYIVEAGLKVRTINYRIAGYFRGVYVYFVNFAK